MSTEVNDIIAKSKQMLHLPETNPTITDMKSTLEYIGVSRKYQNDTLQAINGLEEAELQLINTLEKLLSGVKSY